MRTHLLSTIDYEDLPAPVLDLPVHPVRSGNDHRPPRELSTYVGGPAQWFGSVEVTNHGLMQRHSRDRCAAPLDESMTSQQHRFRACAAEVVNVLGRPVFSRFRFSPLGLAVGDLSL